MFVPPQRGAIHLVSFNTFYLLSSTLAAVVLCLLLRWQDAIPMCVVTGQHMVKEDWCICPRSRMPALLSHYESYLQYEQVGWRNHNHFRRKRNTIWWGTCCAG